MPRGLHLRDDTIEQFLDIVEQSSFLYDPTDRSYMDIQKKNDFWDSVAATLNIEEMDGNSWRSRWRNLRDTYVKQRKLSTKKKTLVHGRKIAKWKFYDRMNFLEPYIIETNSETNFPVKEEFVYESDTEAAGMQEDASSNTSSLSEYQETDSIETSQSRMPKPPVQYKYQWSTTKNSSKGAGTSEEAFADFIKKRKKIHEELQAQDADLLLFQSYALRMKNLPKDMQAVIKMQMSQIFFNAENTNGPQVQVLPTKLSNSQLTFNSQQYEDEQT